MLHVVFAMAVGQTEHKREYNCYNLGVHQASSTCRHSEMINGHQCALVVVLLLPLNVPPLKREHQGVAL